MRHASSLSHRACSMVRSLASLPQLVTLFFCALLLQAQVQGQGPTRVDSLKQALGRAAQPTLQTQITLALAKSYKRESDSAYYYAKIALKLAKQHQTPLLPESFLVMGHVFNAKKQAGKALLYFDSSAVVARSVKDSTALALALYEIGRAHYASSNFAEAVVVFKNALAELQPFKQKLYWETQHSYYEALGVCQKKIGQFEAALASYDQALAVAPTPSKERGRTYYNIRNIYLMQGNAAKGLEYALNALKIFEQLGEPLGIAIAISGIADIYENIENYDEALKQHMAIMKLISDGKISDKGFEAGVCYSIGSEYLGKKVHQDSALYWLNRAEVLYRETGDIATLSGLMSEQGIAYYQMKDYKTAEAKYLESKKSAQKLEYTVQICQVNFLLGQLYFDTNQPNRALPLLKESLACSEEQQYAKVSMVAHEYLSKIYERQGDAKQSLAHFRLYYQLKDSMMSRQKIFEVASLYQKMEQEKQLVKEQGLALEVEKTNNKLNRAWLLGGGVLSVLLLLGGVLSYRQYVKEKKNNKNLQDYIQHLEETKKKLLPLVQAQPLISQGTSENGLQNISHHYLKESMEEIDRYIEILTQGHPEGAPNNQNLTDKKIIEDLKNLNYSISHDLMSPISRIQNLTEDLKNRLPQDLIGPENGQKLTSIALAASQSGKLLLQLLEFSKMEYEELASNTVNSHDLVSDVVLEMSDIFKKNAVEIDVPSQLPPIKGDAFAIRRVFSNLLQNSIKYSKPNSRVKIYIEAFQTDNNVTFSIKDNGIGFPSDEAERIFQPFYRVSRGHILGNGMGLAIVKRIVERHQGSIKAQGNPNEGATFYLTLPAA